MESAKTARKGSAPLLRKTQAGICAGRQALGPLITRGVQTAAQQKG